MGFADEIQQKKPFKSERRKAMINLIYTGYKIGDQMERFFKRWDLTQKQYNALRIVRGAQPEGVSTSYIRDRMLVKRGDASRLVDRLVTKGVLTKCVDPEDRRLILVVLSETGERLLSEIDESLDDMDGCLDKVSIAECKKLNELLDKCREQLPSE